MQYMQNSTRTGLRERKKAATRLAIEEAAVEIACTQGYELATAEAIAEKANVSLRTFFNYFPSKDLAIMGRSRASISGERALQILTETGGDLLKGIAGIAAACVAETDPTSQLMRRRRRLVHENPALFHLHVTADLQFDAWLVGVVAEHLKASPSQRRLGDEATVEAEARLAVTVVSSAVHHLVRQAIEEDVDAVIDAEDIERTIDMMAKIHAGAGRDRT